MRSIYAWDKALQQLEDWWLASGPFYAIFACLAEIRAVANFFANSYKHNLYVNYLGSFL